MAMKSNRLAATGVKSTPKSAGARMPAKPPRSRPSGPNRKSV